MKASLVPDWKRVLKKARSVRWIAVCAVLSTAGDLLPLIAESIPKGVFALLTVLAAGAAIYSRVVQQKELHDGE